MDMQKGTILDFTGSWSSGVAMLTIKIDDGTELSIPCENSQTVRALDACFGGVIVPGHSVGVDAIRGKEIYFSLDDFGMLKGFSPIEPDEMEVN